MLDAVSEWIGGVIATLVAGGVMLYAKTLNAGNRERDRRIGKQGERLAAVESTQAQITGLLSEIRNELRGLRSDQREDIDSLRKEIRAEIAQKADR